MEIKWIPEHEGHYLASTNGHIIGLFCGNHLKPRPLSLSQTMQSCYVGLKKNGKWRTYAVGILIAKTFIPNSEGKRDIIHKNHDIKDNSVKNLKWVTREERIKHGRTKPKSKQKKLTSAELDEKFYALHGRPEWM